MTRADSPGAKGGDGGRGGEVCDDADTVDEAAPLLEGDDTISENRRCATGGGGAFPCVFLVEEDEIDAEDSRGRCGLMY